MNDELVFDWVVAAPIEQIAAVVEQVCLVRGLGGTWYSSARAGVAVKGCRISATDGASLALLNLQGFQPAQTHLRLQPAAHTAQADEVSRLGDALYAAFGANGWVPPMDGPAPRSIGQPGSSPYSNEQKG